MKRTIFLAVFMTVLMAVVVQAGTILPGETRTAIGRVGAVDIREAALVVDAPIEAGMLTVGVTMKPGAVISRNGKAIKLGDLKPGEKVTLIYTRKDDQLIGLEVKAH
jgi:hypothetical protein